MNSETAAQEYFKKFTGPQISQMTPQEIFATGWEAGYEQGGDDAQSVEQRGT